MEYLAQLNVVLEPTGLMAYKIQRAKKSLEILIKYEILYQKYWM